MPRLARAAVLGLGLLAGAAVLWRALVPKAEVVPPCADRVVWLFEPAERGAILASPCVAGDHLYVTAVSDSVFAPRGALYCLDADTGRVRWKFDDDGEMLHGYSSPCVAGGRVYVGEGMHSNLVCRLYCLDADSGKKLWEFEANSHIESSPCVAGGAVFFGAGDDGLYCLDAKTGARRWQLAGPWHIDTSPAVAGGRLYAGSGGSRGRPWLGCLCADAHTGKLLWRETTDLPVWGSPAVDGDRVFFGLGNGKLLEPPPPPLVPAGAVLCLDARSGTRRWRFGLSDGVFGRPAIAGGCVYFGTRNGPCYCVGRDGKERWRRELGGPVRTQLALGDARLYALAGGTVHGLDRESGEPAWTFDVAEHSQMNPALLSSPARAGGRLYFGTELRLPARRAAVLYCLRE